MLSIVALRALTVPGELSLRPFPGLGINDRGHPDRNPFGLWASHTALAVAGIINSVVALGYYITVIRVMYTQPAPAPDPIGEPTALRIALAVAALGTFVLGVLPERFVKLAGIATLLQRP